jgi:hypothetical protein
MLKDRPEMTAKHKCKACRRPFTADARNQKRQSFCDRPECQRIRRTEAQRRRRDRSRKSDSLTRLLKPSEAAWLRRNPFVVGLISVLIGSSDRTEIETYYAALIQRGTKILEGRLLDTSDKRPEGKNLSNQALQ